MIIVRAPLRINFLGGGSDFEEVFKLLGGAVFGTTINLYVYISAASIPPFAKEKFRFTYRISESVDHPLQIKHPVVRTLLLERKDIPALNLATMSDVPGNSGLGSSSSFTVALIELLNVIQRTRMDKLTLASEAIRVERNVLNEKGGWQDQYHAAHGGLTHYEFDTAGDVRISSIPESDPVVDLLNQSMLLIPLAGERQSSDLSEKYIRSIRNSNNLELAKENGDLARYTFQKFLKSNLPPVEKIDLLAEAMKKAWEIKVKTNPDASLQQAITLINQGISAGALAGKLCGAGQHGGH
jgi:D-glycero-alpha-D-manno-heptose-7-phosphate kinase